MDLSHSFIHSFNNVRKGGSGHTLCKALWRQGSDLGIVPAFMEHCLGGQRETDINPVITEGITRSLLQSRLFKQKEEPKAQGCVPGGEERASWLQRGEHGQKGEPEGSWQGATRS